MHLKYCKCNCGYTCGGPGICILWSEDKVDECIDKHFVKDCEHSFSGELVEIGDNCKSILCQKCGMAAISHDMAVGP